jgi:tRNA G37 N-methylase Trm5
MENLILAFLCRDPEQLYRINRFLQKEGLEKLATDDFSASDRQQIAKVIFNSLTQDNKDPDQYIQEELVDFLPVLDEILPKESTQAGKGSLQKQQEVVIRTIMNVRRQYTNTRIQELRYLQTDEDQQSEGESIDQDAINGKMVSLIKARGLLDRCLSRPIIVD